MRKFRTFFSSTRANTLLMRTTDIPVAVKQLYIRVQLLNDEFATQTRFCMEPRTSSPKNEHPCSFLGCQFASKLVYCLEPAASVPLLRYVEYFQQQRAVYTLP